MSKNKKTKTTKRIESKDDYEKSSFKDIIEDMEDTKDKALESLPKIKNRFQQETKYQKKYCMAMVMTIIKDKA